MRRASVLVLTVLAIAASLGNPHHVAGGAHDVYGSTSWWGWWQPASALLSLAAVNAAGVLLWRGAGRRALRLLVAESLLFALVTGLAVWQVGAGHFSDGWGGRFYVPFAVAVAARVLLTCVALQRPGGQRSPTISRGAEAHHDR